MEMIDKNWKIISSVDDDGLLTVSVSHNDETVVSD